MMVRFAQLRANGLRGIADYASVTRCLLLTAATLTFAASAAADTLYYADIFTPNPSSGGLRKIAPSGAGLETIVDLGDGLRGIAVDQAAGHIYFTLVEPPSIRRCNLDGTVVKPLITPTELPALSFPYGIALDLAEDKMYWADTVAQQLCRANLDGSDPQPLNNTPVHGGVALDKINGKIYWSAAISGDYGEILRSNLDGSAIEPVVTSNDTEFKPAAIALDISGGKIYWTDYVVDVVRRSNLDGTNIQTIYTVGANNNPNGIALDLVHGRVYWGQDLDSQQHIGSIMRMGLDGASPETVLVNIGLTPSLFFTQCAADIAPLAGNASVNVGDLLTVINSWGPCADSCAADLTPPPAGDGIVDMNDLMTIVAAWGQCP